MKDIQFTEPRTPFKERLFPSPVICYPYGLISLAVELIVSRECMAGIISCEKRLHRIVIAFFLYPMGVKNIMVALNDSHFTKMNSLTYHIPAHKHIRYTLPDNLL